MTSLLCLHVYIENSALFCPLVLFNHFTEFTQFTDASIVSISRHRLPPYLKFETPLRVTRKMNTFSIETYLDDKHQCFIFTARSSYARAVLGIVILYVRPSVSPSVCHTHALWRNYRTYSWNFDITWKDNHSSFLIPKEVCGRCPRPPKICA